MTIIDFKHNAKITEDNRETASKNWMKSWGFDFWFNLWGYRTYELGRFKYKSGKVSMRHYTYNYAECYIDGQTVTKNKFKKALANEPLPTYTPSEPTPKTARKRLTNNATQLEMAF